VETVRRGGHHQVRQVISLVGTITHATATVRRPTTTGGEAGEASEDVGEDGGRGAAEGGSAPRAATTTEQGQAL
jgi:hypothetical protein